MPPEQANQVFAQLVHGTALTMATMKQPLYTRKGKILHSLLLWGQRENRRVFHSGLGQAPATPFDYIPPAGPRDMASVTHQPGQAGIIAMEATPRAAGSVTAIAHEGVHEAQSNHSQPYGHTSAVLGQPREPQYDIAGHAREHSLRLGLQLVNLRDIVDTEADIPQAVHAALPPENQAYLEEAALAALVAELDPHLPHDEPVKFGWAMEDRLGLDRLAPHLISAAVDLNSHHETAEELALPDQFHARYESSRHPEAATHIQGILRAMADIDEATASQAWSDGRQPTAEEFDFAKSRTDVKLSEALSNIGRGAQPGQPSFDTPTPERVAAAIRSARTGFDAGVQELKEKMAEGGAIDEADIQRTVMQLVGSLTELKIDNDRANTREKTLLSSLRPEVHLFDAPLAIPREEGFNLAEQQTRKGVFEPLTWQLHVPREWLQDPEHLADRLAGMATDVAFNLSAMMHAGGHAKEGVQPRSDARLTGMLKEHRLLTLEEIRACAQQLAPLAAARTDAAPASAAAALRSIVCGIPRGKTDRLWHEGWRSEVKFVAQGGQLEGSTPDIETALAAYYARSLERWELPLVAFRRAVKALTSDGAAG